MVNIRVLKEVKFDTAFWGKLVAWVEESQGSTGKNLRAVCNLEHSSVYFVKPQEQNLHDSRI